MQQVIYSCDKCKKKVEEKEDLQWIAIGFNDRGYDFYPNIKLELCNSCAEKIGLIKRVIKQDKIINEKQDLKDRLYDIAVDLIQESGIQID